MESWKTKPAESPQLYDIVVVLYVTDTHSVLSLVGRQMSPSRVWGVKEWGLVPLCYSSQPSRSSWWCCIVLEGPNKNIFDLLVLTKLTIQRYLTEHCYTHSKQRHMLQCWPTQQDRGDVDIQSLLGSNRHLEARGVESASSLLLPWQEAGPWLNEGLPAWCSHTQMH